MMSTHVKIYLGDLNRIIYCATFENHVKLHLVPKYPKLIKMLLKLV